MANVAVGKRIVMSQQYSKSDYCDYVVIIILSLSWPMVVAGNGILTLLLLSTVRVVRHVIRFFLERYRAGRRRSEAAGLLFLLVSGRSVVVRLTVRSEVVLLLMHVLHRLLVFTIWRVNGSRLRRSDLWRPVVVAAVSERAVIVL